MIRGKVWKFGDDVNTDVITPGKYLTIREPEKLAPHVMESIDPEFTSKAKPRDLIVAGKNFGCGIVASFARIFLRNAINIALPIL